MMTNKFNANVLKKNYLRVKRKLFPKSNSVFKYGDMKFLIPLRSEYYNHIFFKGAYESDIFLFLSRYLSKEMIVVDIGANIGLFTLLSANLVGKGGQVICFEPDNRPLSFLSKNIDMNKFANIIVKPIAVSDCAKRVEFHQANDSVYSSISKPIGPANQEVCVTTVKCDTLDNLLHKESIGHIDLLKIDAEGSEYNVILGAERIIRNNKNIVIICEFSGAAQVSSGYSTDQLRELFINTGLEIFSFDPVENTLKIEPEGREYDYKNLIICRNETANLVSSTIQKKASVGLMFWH